MSEMKQNYLNFVCNRPKFLACSFIIGWNDILNCSCGISLVSKVSVRNQPKIVKNNKSKITRSGWIFSLIFFSVVTGFYLIILWREIKRGFKVKPYFRAPNLSSAALAWGKMQRKFSTNIKFRITSKYQPKSWILTNFYRSTHIWDFKIIEISEKNILGVKSFITTVIIWNN